MSENNNAIKEIINYGNIDNTSEKDSRVYKVYAYICNDNNKLYIGQTCKTMVERAHRNGSGYNSCTAFANAINKHGWENFKPIVLIDGLSKDMADIVEIELIKKYNTRNYEFGYNIEIGGYHSGSACAKRVYRYTLDGIYIDSYDSISEAGRSLGIYGYNIIRDCLSNRHGCKTAYGYLWSDEYFDKLPPFINNCGKNMEKRIFQYDMNGKFLFVYDKISDAKKALNIKNLSHNNLFLVEDIFHAHNYLWTFSDRGEELEEEDLQQILWRLNNGLNKSKIYQYDLNGNLVMIHDSIKDAANSINTTPSAIHAACNRKTKYAKGFLWNYNELSDKELFDLIKQKGKGRNRKNG